MPRAKIASVLPIDDVIARVREAANWSGRAGKPLRHGEHCRAARSSPMRRPSGTPDPYAGFEARIVPENITLLPKTAAQTTGGNAWNETRRHRQEGRHHRDDPARSRRHAGRHQGDRRGARRARPRRRPQGRPEAARADVADRRRQPPAADPRHRRERQRDRGGRRARPTPANMSRSTCRASIPQWRDAATRTTRTTAAACGSIRASTRPRCATRCRTPSSTN